MSGGPNKLRIYLDIIGDIVKSNVSFKSNMITDLDTSSKSSSSKLSKLTASTFYFTDKIKYTKALFKKYNLDNVKLAVKIFTDENKSRRFFRRLESQQKKITQTGKTQTGKTQTGKTELQEQSSEKDDSKQTMQDELNQKAKLAWNIKITNLKKENTQNAGDSTITKSQLQQLRDNVKQDLLPDDDSAVDQFTTKKTLQKALSYAEKEYISSKNPKNDCPPNCFAENITFLLELFFKQRQQLSLQGKSYSIINVTPKKPQKQRGVNIVSVALKVFDSSKPQDTLVYYDCGGKKAQLKKQLTKMFPNVLDFFDIDANVKKTSQSIDESDKRALIDAYNSERVKYRKLQRQLERLEISRSDIDMDKIDELEIELEKKAAYLDSLEDILRKNKLFSRISNSRKTRRSRFQSRSNRNAFYDSFGRYQYNYGGGKKKYTKKKGRNIRITRKKRNY